MKYSVILNDAWALEEIFFPGVCYCFQIIGLYTSDASNFAERGMH